MSSKQYAKQIMASFFMIIGISYYSYSQTNYSFKTFNQDNGLSDNYIECLFEDSRGFIWIGTRNGLNRFDGHSFTRITLPRMPSAPSIEIGQHYINALTQDSKDRLWIGTLAGLYIYDLPNDTFYPHEYREGDSTSLSFNLIEGFSVDSNNCMWVSTRHGLNKYNEATNSFTRYMADSSNPQSLTDNYIFSINHDSNHTLWIGTLTGGLNEMLPTKGTYNNKYTNNNYNIREVRRIYEDSNNTLWLISSQDGIYYKKINDKNFTKLHTIEYIRNYKFFTALSDIQEDTHGNLWISSFMGGVAIFNPHTQSFKFYKEDTPAPLSICNNSIRGVYRDKIGNMWIYSHGGGISLYSPISSAVATYQRSPFANSLPGNIVSCFEEAQDGSLYIGTDGAGFSVFNPHTQTFTNYSISDGFSSDAILDIKEIKKNIFAIASWNGGLDIYNATTKTVKSYTNKVSNSSTVAFNMYGLHYDSIRQLLWCNTYGDGITIFDCTTYRFLHEHEVKAIYPHYRSSMFSSKLLFDYIDSSTWILDGVVIARIHDSVEERFTHSDSLSACTDGYFSNDMIQAADGTIYIASYSGFKYYDRQDKCLKNIEFPHVSFSDAKALVEDKHGNIWIATPYDLYVYNPSAQTIRNMSHVWGMPYVQFYRKSAYRSNDGHLYFGSLNGFIVLHEDSTYTYNITPNIHITKLFINNIEQHPHTSDSPIQKDITLLKEIYLRPHQLFVTIEFGILNFIDNEKSLSRYKLDGFDSQWILAGKERRVTYTNLPSGTYHFLIETTNSEGVWIDSPHSLTIHVLPPWWKTTWFIVICIFVCIGSVILFIYLREKNIQDTKKQLETTVDEKTKELIQANLELSEQKSTIETHYENLREQQLVIEIKNSQLQEALDTKNKLLTVIAHDFKNAISGLVGFANLLRDKIQEKKMPELLSYIQPINQSAHTILQQMNEVLEWSVSKEDTIQYNPLDINIEILIRDSLLLVQESALLKNILLESHFKISHSAYVDPRMVSTIIRNLLMNSIKFTPRNGKITIIASQTKKFIEIAVKDTGIGMNKEQIERILSDNYVIASDYKNGFGLQLCKTFVKRNNGTLDIESEVGAGSTFTVTVPIGSPIEGASLKKKEIIYDTNIDFENEDTQRKMLVVDDNRDITQYLQELFSDTFHVIVAHNGREGIDKALQSLPEIILSDINMPEINGKELCVQLKENGLTSHIPIILISAMAQPHEQIESLQLGADDFIEKPFNANVLKQKVYMLLRNREKLIEHIRQSMNITEKFNLPDSFDDKIIQEITQVIIENISNVDFKVDMLAQKVGLSRSQLYRKTVSVLGQSPNDYIKSLRLQQAVEMLKTGRYRISEIAYEVGFSDPGYFSSCFYEKYRIKPSDYGKSSEEKPHTSSE